MLKTFSAILLFSLGLLYCSSTPPINAAEEFHYYHITNTTPLSQLPDLSNGCEAVAATMLLNWAGVSVKKEDIANALPKGDMPAANDDDAMIGANPQYVFVGDPFSVGFGVFHAPVANVINTYLPGNIKDITGASFNDLLETIKSGKPVVVWATENMVTPNIALEWQDYNGDIVDWYEPEHALLMTGWDDDHAYMNDPMTGKEERYSLWDFKDVWETMGSQAITVN
ncbi:C39 family peptidase [Paenibacillus sp. GP183]|uniref:C39 family peptidase n=1 Tax=Paenibacillus sp. GP183 TaxID=1882751 RepID=UPI000B8256CC|nr:C39 family peptidase [Paenibacillus sp. GP183]